MRKSENPPRERQKEQKRKTAAVDSVFARRERERRKNQKIKCSLGTNESEDDLVLSNFLFFFDDDLATFSVELLLVHRCPLENLLDNFHASFDNLLELARATRVVDVDVVGREQTCLLAESLNAVDDFSCSTFLFEFGSSEDVEEDDDIVVRVGLVVRSSFDLGGKFDVTSRREISLGEFDPVDRDLARLEVSLDVVRSDVREGLLDSGEILSEFAAEDGVIGVGAELDPASCFVRGEDDGSDVEFLFDVRKERFDIVEVLLRRVEDNEFGERGLERDDHPFSSGTTELNDRLKARDLSFDGSVKVLFSGLRERKEMERSNVISNAESRDVVGEERSETLIDVLSDEGSEGRKGSDESEKSFEKSVEGVRSIFESVLSLESSSIESDVPIR